MGMGPEGHETKNDCTDEDQQESTKGCPVKGKVKVKVSLLQAIEAHRVARG
jgi:hypothetical protein